jgi:hypothetical protein
MVRRIPLLLPDSLEWLTMKRNTFAAAALLLIVAVAVLSACGTQSGGIATTSTAYVTVVSSPAAPAPGHGGGGLPFTSPVELAHHYNVGVFAPEGIALHGGVTSETDAKGNLTNYGMGLFNDFGSLYVAGAAPPSAADYRTAADDDKQRTILSRTVVKVQGHDAVLILEREPGPVGSRDYRLLWAQGGRVLQIGAPERVGSDSIIAVANATKFFTLAEIDRANIIVDTRPDPTGGPVVYATPAEAAAVLGVPVFAPPTYKRVLVWPDRLTGKPARWEVDIDDQVFVERSEQATIPTDAELRAAVQGAPEIDRIQVAGVPAAFVKRLGAPSKLYFVAEGIALVVVDLSGKRDVNEIASVANSVKVSAVTSSCCSLQLDMDPGTTGVQASRRVAGPQDDISIDIVLGDNVGNLSAFNFSLVYDDTHLTPVAAASGGLNGNPDFNEIALSDTWNCGLGGSPSPDTDAATGPGHGVAFLSCFTTAQGAAISTATVIATLRLHAAASGTSSITIDDADFSRYDGTSIGTCDAGGGTMTCVGGSVIIP